MTAESATVSAPATAAASASGPAEEVAPTPQRMRGAMGSFATGVTVVTGLDGAGEPVGFACQSFASVSLEPPLVLFCADHKGRAWPALRETGRFCVNALAEEQRGLCERFGSRKGLKYEGLDWELSPWRTPSLPGVLMRAHAEVHAIHVAGDHDVVIGRVLALETPGAERPMLFFRGQYGVEEPVPVPVPHPWGWGDRWG